MRSINELSLLVAIVLLPPAVATGLFGTGQIAFVWLPLSLVISALFACIGIYRINRRTFSPLDQLVTQLRRRQITPASGETSDEINQVIRAIDSFATLLEGESADELARLKNELSELADRNEKAEAMFKLERQSFIEKEQRLDEHAAHLDAIWILIGPVLRQFIGSYNRKDNRKGADLTRAAAKIEFLLQQASPVLPEEQIETCDVLSVLDDAIDLVAPLLRSNQCHIPVLLDSTCPTRLGFDARRLKQLLFLLVLEHLRQKASVTTIPLTVSYVKDKISLNFAEGLSITPELNDLVSTNDADWTSNVLTFPAHLPGDRNPMPVDCGLTALVVTDNEPERTSLTQRLNLLGVTCTTDFKSEGLDMCFVSDEKSETFRAIQPYLPGTTYIVLLNNRELYNKPYWIQLEDPVNQTALASLIEDIGQLRDESSLKHVLAVDDSQANMQLLEMQLKELGHTVTKASSGEQALGFLKQENCELIFMDIQMPGMDGVEATRRIREMGVRAPVIGLTAHATSQERETYEEAGMNDVLIKPVRMENLKSIIRRVTRQAGKPPMAAASPAGAPVFDRDLALSNANQRLELAEELLTMLIESLPQDQKLINDSITDRDALKRAVHKLHGAVRYCGVPRLGRAIEKLETALKQDDEEQVPILLNLVNGEIIALQNWHRDNPSIFDAPSSRTTRH